MAVSVLIRSPTGRRVARVENADVVTPAGWYLEDVHLCWRWAEHTTVDAFLEQID